MFDIERTYINCRFYEDKRIEKIYELMRMELFYLKSQKSTLTKMNATRKFIDFEDADYLKLKRKVKAHNLRSGEIILEICQIQTRFFSVNDLVINFFRSVGIRTEETAFDNRKINFEKQRLSQETALQKIMYALSIKPNFTLIDYPISPYQAQKYAEQFISFFENPRFYAYQSRLYQKTLDLSDLWEADGFLIMDDNRVGIFWVNDLYDWIDPEFSPLFSSFIG